MLRLLHIDLKKHIQYPTSWIILTAFFLIPVLTLPIAINTLFDAVASITQRQSTGSAATHPALSFPFIWHALTWWSGLFKFVLAAFVIVSISNEFEYKTLRQHVIDGLSRVDFIVSKTLMNLMLALISCAALLIVVLVVGAVNATPDSLSIEVIDLRYFPGYFLELSTYLSLTLFVAVVVRQVGLSFLALGSLNLIEYFFRADLTENYPHLARYFPLAAIGELVPFPMVIDSPAAPATLLIAVGWQIIFIFLTFMNLEMSDL